jgi:hypothetical protein
MRRDALSVAFSGRNEATLAPLLAFLTKYVNDRRWGVRVLHICDYLLGKCGSVLTLSFFQISIQVLWGSHL